MSVSDKALVYPGVVLGRNVEVQPFAVVGAPTRRLRNGQALRPAQPASSTSETRIGDESYIGFGAVVEEGVLLQARVVLEHGAVVESRVTIGADTFVVHGARILTNAEIGKQCVIGGLIADRSVVASGCRVFGMLIHRQDRPRTGWDDTLEEAPVLEQDVFIASGATVIGPVRIGTGAYVCANAVVTKDVPPHSIVVGFNQVTPGNSWRGRLRIRTPDGAV